MNSKHNIAHRGKNSRIENWNDKNFPIWVTEGELVEKKRIVLGTCGIITKEPMLMTSEL